MSSPGEPLKVEEFRRHFLGTFGREWRRRLTVDEARDAAHVLFDDGGEFLFRREMGPLKLTMVTPCSYTLQTLAKDGRGPFSGL